MKNKVAFLGSYLDICTIHASRLRMTLSQDLVQYLDVLEVKARAIQQTWIQELS